MKGVIYIGLPFQSTHYAYGGYAELCLVYETHVLYQSDLPVDFFTELWKVLSIYISVREKTNFTDPFLGSKFSAKSFCLAIVNDMSSHLVYLNICIKYMHNKPLKI